MTPLPSALPGLLLTASRRGGNGDDDGPAPAPRPTRRQPRQSSTPASPAVRVLIFADDAARAAALKRTFVRLGHTVHIAVRLRERRRLLRHHPPGIVIVSVARRDLATEQTIDEIRREGSARILLVIARDAKERLLIEILRRGARGYEPISSVTLTEHATDHSLWTWIAAMANTLSLEPVTPRRRVRRRRLD